MSGFTASSIQETVNVTGVIFSSVIDVNRCSLAKGDTNYFYSKPSIQCLYYHIRQILSWLQYKTDVGVHCSIKSQT